jgi:hypothetical protein
MNWYIDTLMKVLTKPKHFFDNMPGASWKDEPLTFALISGWILAFALTTVVFINTYFPTGLSLIDGIYGRKLLIVFPVLVVMGFAFFAMTVLIIGGIMIMAILAMLFFCAAILNFILLLLKGCGSLMDVFKGMLFSFAPLMVFFVNIILMILVKYKLLPMGVWVMLEKIVYYCAVIFMFVLFGHIAAVTHKVSKWKAYLAASVPFVLLVLFNLVLFSKILSKLTGFLN